MSEGLDFLVICGSEKYQKELEKIKIEGLREKHREQKLAYREQQREYFLNKVRFLEDGPKYDDFVEGDISVLAKSLKHKSQVSCEILNAVMNALLNGEENITAFLKEDGALQALLRLLSGLNEKYQLLSAQCICNLALGNIKQSLQVLKVAKSYLILHLSGRNPYVKEVCAVALGNLCRQGMQNIELLMKQGFLPKIISLLYDGNPNVEAAAIYALTQLVYQGFDILGAEDKMNCLLAITPLFTKRSFLVAFLMSLLSSSKETHQYLISEGMHYEALSHLLISLKEKEKESLYYLRIISNLSAEEFVARDLIENQHFTIRECVSCLLHSDKQYLQKECLSWLGNFFNNKTNLSKHFVVEIIKENLGSIKLYKESSEKNLS